MGFGNCWGCEWAFSFSPDGLSDVLRSFRAFELMTLWLVGMRHVWQASHTLAAESTSTTETTFVCQAYVRMGCAY